MYSILQLNFIYIYQYCSNQGLDVSEYSNRDINSIKSDDLKILFYSMLNQKGLSVSSNTFSYCSNVEELLQLPETKLLTNFNSLDLESIRIVRNFKHDIENIFSRESRLFIVDLKKTIISQLDIIIKHLSALSNLKSYGERNEDNSAIINLLF